MTSHAPDITGTIPSVLSARTTVTTTYVQSGAVYDFSLAGLPFLMAPSQDRPYRRSTAQYRRQQIDTSLEPGEQTLSTWWVRDQDSWHRGAGINYYDPGRINLYYPGTEQDTRYRFDDSRGVDVWTHGQATLLKQCDNQFSTADPDAVFVTGGTVDGDPVLLTSIAGVVSRWDGITTQDYTNVTGTPASRVVVAGKVILTGSTDGIMSGDIDGSSLDLLWTSAGSVLVPFWAKSRIIAAQDNSLFELTLAGGALGASLWDHPASDWTWTSVAETPTSILAAGYSGGMSAVYTFDLIDTGSSSTPILGAAIQAMELPPGEQVRSLSVYLGSYLAIGTNLGLRIGLLDLNGHISYGPLLLETDGPVVDVCARDRFIYALTTNPEGEPAAVRVDLSQVITDLVYAYAWDAAVHATKVPSTLALMGERVAIAAFESGVWVQGDLYETDGWVKSGRVRFATTEQKYFQSIKVRSSIPGATGTGIRVNSIDEADNTTFIIALASTFQTAEDINFGQAKQQQMAVKLELTASDDQTETPTLQGWQMKAQPVPPKQRTIEIPLMIFDFELDRRGNTVGVQDGAWIRLQALEDLESEGAIFNAQDLTTSESFSARIEQVEFVRTSPPEGFSGGFGGFVHLTIIKLQ